MLVGVVLSGFLGMKSGVGMVPMCDISVMTGLFVIANLVMFGGFLMMPRGVLMVFGSFKVMLGAFVLSHVRLLLFSIAANLPVPDSKRQAASHFGAIARLWSSSPEPRSPMSIESLSSTLPLVHLAFFSLASSVNTFLI